MVLSNTITLLLKSCYLIGIISPLLGDDCLTRKEIKNKPYLEFSIQSGQSCWEYCKHLASCTAFSFSLQRSELCSLYNDPVLNYWLTRKGNEIYSGTKICKQITEVGKIFGKDTRRKGVLIRQERTGACLAVSSVPWSEGDGNLTWVQECKTADRWIVERLNVTAHGNLVRISSNKSGNCLTRGDKYSLKGPYSQVVMKKCSSAAEEEKQNFILLAIDVIEAVGKWTLLNPSSFNIATLCCSSNGVERQSLNGIFLVQPDFPCSRLHLEHGRVLLNSSQPLHLPGERIQVLCDTGYGVKTETGYSQYFTTVCYNDLVPPECVDMSLESGNAECGLELVTILPAMYLYLSTSIASFFLLFLCCVTCVQRKQIQCLELSASEKEKHQGEPRPMELSTTLEDTEIKN